MASSVGGSAVPAAKVSQDAVRTIKSMNMSCQVGKINAPTKASPLRRGEVEFTGLGPGGHRAHYLIVPPDLEDADEILRWMFIRKDGWRMTKPNLLLSCFGGRDHYVNWAQSSTLKNRQAWVPGGLNGELHDWQFSKKFKSRLEEIAGGVCQAVTECGGWFDAGKGSRGGLNEVLMDGLKVYWSAFGALAGHKSSNVVFAIRSLEDTEFAEQFEACAKPVPLEEDEPPEPIVERVLYPGVNAQIFPELMGAMTEDTEQDLDGFEDDSGEKVGDMAAHKNEVRHAVVRRFLSNACTHIIFLQNRQVEDKLKLKMKSLATRAVIFANGAMPLINPGVEGKILMEAMAGVPVVCLHNTGGSAEALGAAVLKRRRPDMVPPAEYHYALPENVADDNFLILNPAKDSVEKVINKLTLVLSTVQDSEMTEVGYAKAEENRLLYAWELYSLYVYNSRIFRFRMRAFQYTAMTLSLLVTFASLMWEVLKEGHVQNEMTLLSTGQADSLVNHGHVFKTSLLVLPVLSGFVLTLISRINPLGKWANLASGAVQIKSEIYQYRCRVLEYMPRKTGSLDIEELVEDLCDSEPTGARAAELAAIKKKKKRKDASMPKELSRRVTFSNQLESINSDAVGSDIRGDSLAQPPESFTQEICDSFYDSKRVKNEHDFRHSSCIRKFISSCCRSASTNGHNARNHNRVGGDEVSDALLEAGSANIWDRVGSDYSPNPMMIEDDYLRDDGMSLVTAEDYIHFRFLPLLQYYNRRSSELTSRVQTLQTAIFFFTAVLAGAGPLGYERWVPFVVALIGFLNGTLEFENYPSQLRNVNQSLESLKNLRIWWQSLSMVERRMPLNKHALVGATEATADAEISAWKKSLRTTAMKRGGGGAAEEEEQAKDD